MKIKNTSKTNKSEKRKKIVIAIICFALMLFLIAGLAIAAEINSLYSELENQKALLEDSINKTVTAYMETKYLGTDNDTGKTEGEITSDALSDEDIQAILAELMPIISSYITDDVYNGVSELMVDDLKSAIASAVQAKLLEMGISSETLTDEITLLVLKSIQTNLSEYSQSISQNAENISVISSSVSGIESNISNLNSTIESLQAGYDSQIATLKSVDSALASRIDSLLSTTSTSTEEYNQKIAELLAQLASLEETVSSNSDSANNTYEDINQQISNTNTTINATAEELQQQIDYLQSIINSYVNDNNVITGGIQERTDGGSGKQMTLIIPDSN